MPRFDLAVYRKVVMAYRAVPKLIVAFALTVKGTARIFEQLFKLWGIVGHDTGPTHQKESKLQGWLKS